MTTIYITTTTNPSWYPLNEEGMAFPAVFQIHGDFEEIKKAVVDELGITDAVFKIGPVDSITQINLIGFHTGLNFEPPSVEFMENFKLNKDDYLLTLCVKYQKNTGVNTPVFDEPKWFFTCFNQ